MNDGRATPVARAAVNDLVVARLDELPPGGLRRVEVNGVPVVLARHEQDAAPGRQGGRRPWR